MNWSWNEWFKKNKRYINIQFAVKTEEVKLYNYKKHQTSNWMWMTHE